MRAGEERIFLVGPMGAGKSTIGRCLAERLGREFCDCDQEIERRTGASVALIFAVEGEAGFRRWETLVLEDLVTRPNVVVATGVLLNRWPRSGRSPRNGTLVTVRRRLF